VGDQLPHVVVGAGPAAVAAAKALTAAGEPVVMLDVGLTLEPEREHARRRMAATARAGWSPADVALTGFSAEGSGGAGYKQLLGSDVAFRDDGVLDLRLGPGVGARPSYARGGLSNVWGAGVLPYAADDLDGWPIGTDDLSEGYRAAFGFVPHAGAADELLSRYPLMSPPDGPLLRSDAAERLLARFRAHAGRLGRAGYTFGGARLAVRVGHPAPEAGCVYCLHCLDGCPYGHIYNASDTVSEMRDAGLIDYRPGVHVDAVREHDGEVEVQVTRLHDGAAATVAGRRVFLAAGALSSTVILQRSGLLAKRAELMDSQTLYLPFAWMGRVGDTGRAPGHTLAQLFLILDDPNVCPHPVHISLYTYNSGLTERARATHPRLTGLIGPALDAITRRLVIGICFLHSDHSHRIASTLGDDGRSVGLALVENPQTAPTLSRLQRALGRSLAPLGLVPLAPVAERAPAGGGFHFGGSAPMAAASAEGRSDTLGRPADARRVHIVDSACFPSIPSGTITLPAMANAHRIATAVTREEVGLR
jgi:choline dehydrogenase-like flavoprotein